MTSTLRTFIEKTERVVDAEPLFRLFDTFVGAFGVDVTSYHIMSEQLRAVPVETGLVRETLPDEWVKTYLARDYVSIDPMISMARFEAEPFYWFDVEKKMKLTREQRFFLAELRGAGLTDGLAVPIFGPMGTMAYFGLGAVNDTLDLPREEIMELQFACQRTHNKYVDITAHLAPGAAKPKLSSRETEVLSLIATGLSNNTIAERLGITENTVDTIVRRSFRKLGVNNRITAVLRGVGAGLILP